MTQVSYPGVYIQEIPSGVRPIRAVSTAIAAFIDFFPEGPMNEAVRIQGMGDFNRHFGGLDTRSAASYAIAQFFLNGGGEAHVVRVASPDGTNVARRAQVIIQDGNAARAFGVRAANEGTWGNRVRVLITPAADGLGAFDLGVTRYASAEATAEATEAEGPYLGLSVASANERYVETLVNEESRLIQVVHGTAIGTPPAAPVEPAANGTLGAALDLDSATPASGTFIVDVHDDIDAGVIGNPHLATFTAPTELTLNRFRRAVEQAIRQSVPNTATGGPTHALLAGATVRLVGSRLLVRTGRRSDVYHPHLRIRFTEDGGTTAAGLNLDSVASTVFENVQEYALGYTGAAALGAQAGATDFDGQDGLPPDATALRGDPDDETGIYALEQVDLFNILCIPRTAHADLAGGTGAQMRAVVDEARVYCERRRAFMIIDIPEAINSVEEMEEWITDFDGFRHRNTATYFPRLQIPDPENDYRDRSVGASGTMAGLYARTDGARGVWKAPAGVEARLRGVSRLDVNLTDAQNGTLNPIAVNCLRTFPIYGPVSWGGRTLDGSDVTGSEWQYIPIRRLALMIEESLFRGTKWVVFEPNDEPLWAKIRQNIGTFMMRLFRQGAFQGDTPSKAFYVKCDGETTLAADRLLGIVNIEVGFAALKPAEFVVIKIQQIPDVD